MFAACTRRELRTLLRWGDEVDLPAGVTVWRQNAIGNCFVVVLSGRLRLQRGRRLIGTVGPGGWTGEVAVLGFGPQPATVTTDADCRLFVLGARALLSYAATLPGLRAGLFGGLSEREAVERIRSMRSEGLPLWRTLRRPPPRDVGPMPSWFRVYPTHRSGGALGVAPSHTVPRTTTAHVEGLSRRGMVIVSLVAAIALAAAATTIPVPYHTLRGNLRSATASIHVSAATSYLPSGRILFPVVDVHQDTTLEAVLDQFDPDDDVSSSANVEGEQSAAELTRANLRLMTQSKHNATAVALTTIAGGVGGPSVTIDTGDLGGPSGGLAFALAIIDLLTPGELTGGHTVAATGAITSDGSVEPVGGVRLKAIAARRQHVDFLIVPSANVPEATSAAGPVPVIGVDSLADALRFLASVGGSRS